MIDSPTSAIVADLDMLSPQQTTWTRDTWKNPRIQRAISNVWRSFEENAPTDAERAYAAEMARKWGQS